MSLTRSAGKFVGGILFSLALALAITAAGLADFTARGNAIPFFTNILGPYATATIRQSVQGVDNYAQRQDVLAMCEGREALQSGAVDMSSVGGGSLQISISCPELIAATEYSPDVAATVGNLTAKAVANALYDYNYTCGFVDCMQQGRLLVVMSAEGNAFFLFVQPVLAIITAAGAVMLLAANENWAARLKSIGTHTAMVGVAYFILTFGKSYMISAMVPSSAKAQLATAGIDIGAMVDSVVGPMNDMLLYTFVAGVAIVAAGYIIAWRWPEKARVQPQQPQSVLDIKK
ncbi:MAG: hypothetical protein NT016_00710 [Candidatus Aenigmarchaeota archaeon]|nr:hypothetical protein [Candidatus Aenigmarchaeota archaeon]